jgi:glucosyl-3-phosphoglycerate synthase
MTDGSISSVIEAWRERRSRAASEYPIERLVEGKRHSVSVVLPARNVAATIGPILDVLGGLHRRGLVDEVVVVDSNSADDTPEIALARGVPIFQESELLPEFGPALGKGDALWRGASATTGDIVVFQDADTENFHESFITGLVGPLLLDDSVHLVKAAFTKPLRLRDGVVPDAGGRVTELVARPFLNLFFPELTGFIQPLAGEVALRRRLLERLHFPVGYGVEIAMLIDAFRLVGLDGLAQVDVGARENPHQLLTDLTAMAYGVLGAAAARVGGVMEKNSASGELILSRSSGFEVQEVALADRPPLRDVSMLGSRA